MTPDQLFRLAEDNHVRLSLVFNPGHDPAYPSRGYHFNIGVMGAEKASTPVCGRVEEAVQSAVGTAFRLIAELRDRVIDQPPEPESVRAKAGKTKPPPKPEPPETVDDDDPDEDEYDDD